MTPAEILANCLLEDTIVGEATKAEGRIALAALLNICAERDALRLSNDSLMQHRATIEGVVSRAEKAEGALRELRDAARPFGEMAQEMLNGYPTGRLPYGAPERFLKALGESA